MTDLTEFNEIQEIQENSASQRQTSSSLILNVETMTAVSNFAQVMAGGVATVPKHLQGNVSDCMAICMQAMQWNMNPFAVAQKTHLINGILGYEAQLVNAVVSSSKAIKGRFHYEYSGDWSVKGAGVGVVEKQQKGQNVNTGTQMDASAWVRVGAVLAGDDFITWGEPLYPAAQKVKNSPLWQTNPKQQASYLAVKHWTRLYTPDVILGVYTPDELEEREEREINPRRAAPTPKPKVSAFSSLKGKKAPKPEPIESEAYEEVNTETGEIVSASENFTKWEMSILDCSSLDELQEVGAALTKDMSLEVFELDSLRRLYATRKNKLS